MRTCFIELCATAVALVAGSCRFPTTTAPTCDDDVKLCPHSSREATSVTCDCRCTVGSGDDSSNTFEGKVAVCLPPALNAMSADGAQRVALDAMDAPTFDQRVYRYCSGNVAGFVRLAIKAHADLKLAGCVMPVQCDCATGGTRRDSEICHTPCSEVACTADNCRSILRREAKLDIGACTCARSTVCGESQPSEDEPYLCRDWMTSLH